MDVFPDGRYRPIPGTPPRSEPTVEFPPLPRTDAERRDGWKRAHDQCQRTMQIVDESEDGIWTIATTHASPLDKMIRRIPAPTYHRFNPRQGRTLGNITTYHPWDTKSSTVQSEPTFTRIGDEERARLADEAQRYFALWARTQKILRAGPSPAELKAAHEESHRLVVEAQPTFHEPAIADVLRGISHDFERRMERLDEQLQHNASRIGRVAPPWTLTDLDGKSHSLAEYQGRVVLLTFWFGRATEVLQTLAELPELRDKLGRQGLEVVALGINADDNPDKAREVTEGLRLNVPTLMGGQSDLTKRYGVELYPTTFVIDPEGQIVDLFEGSIGSRSISVSDTVARALKQPLPPLPTPEITD
jgi:peroxiredoxin